MTAVVLRGDARNLPLPDASVDLICTSPPYFALRSYTDGGEHYAGQIGSEATPAEFVAALLDCTREWVRVLKPSGSLFVNLGDKYSLNNRGSGFSREGLKGRELSDKPQMKRVLPWPEKCLMGLPWRYALGCIDQLGLILRAEIVWAKPNGLPESVTDRVRRSHEQVFHFTRLPRYFAAVDEIREPHLHGGLGPTWEQRKAMGQAMRHGDTNGGASLGAPGPKAGNPLGKLPGSVWTIPSAPLTVPPHLGVDHFAAFPPALVRPIVLGWSPAGICTRCGEGRRPVVDRGTLDAAAAAAISARRSGSTRLGTGGEGQSRRSGATSAAKLGLSGQEFNRLRSPDAITGYACACPHPDAPARPAVVLDPFGGTGTTALVASVYGRHGITIDMSADYCRLAQWRTRDPAERARAMDVPKPPPVPDGMEPLFAI